MTKSVLSMRGYDRTLSETREIIVRCLQTNIIPMIWGDSGIGKTAMIEDLIKSIPKTRQITLSLGNRDPLDFTGVPSIVDGRTVTNDPDLIPLEGDDLGEDIEKVIVYIDELPEGDTPTLKAVYRLLNERVVNNTPVHKAVRFVASGNPASVGAHTEKLIPTVANRMMHVTVKADYKEWIMWATRAGVSPVQRAFIATYPDDLNKYDPSSDEDSFPTSRSHARLAEYLKGLDLTDKKNHIVQGAPIQFLGKTVGMKLLDFAEATDLPPIDSILADPEGFDMDSLSPGSMFLLGQSLVSVTTVDNIDKVLEVMDRMPENHKALNFMSLTAHPIEVMTKLLHNKNFMDFTVRNTEILEMVNKANRR